MAKTFKDLCDDLIQETGISGGSGLQTVVGQTGDFAKAVYWIAEADIYIQDLWNDWMFLWEDVTVDLSKDSATIPNPDTVSGNSDTVRFIDRRSMGVIDSGSVMFPEYKDWRIFTRSYSYETESATDTPSYYSQKPNGTLVLDAPINSSGLTARYEYWKRPVRMSVDADESLIPDEFRRLIVVKAKISYAEHEDAPEVMSGSAAEYDDLLEKLQSAQLPGQRGSRTSQLDIGLVEYPEDGAGPERQYPGSW